MDFVSKSQEITYMEKSILIFQLMFLSKGNERHKHSKNGCILKCFNNNDISFTFKFSFLKIKIIIMIKPNIKPLSI
jgi:hypothetical protein